MNKEKRSHDHKSPKIVNRVRYKTAGVRIFSHLSIGIH